MARRVASKGTTTGTTEDRSSVAGTAQDRTVNPDAVELAGVEPATSTWDRATDGELYHKCVCGMRFSADKARSNGWKCTNGNCARAVHPPAADTPKPQVPTAAQVVEGAAAGMDRVFKDLTSRARGVITDDAARGDASDEGETVTATWGKELFSPVRYHTYEVGPFSGTTTVRAGETRADAVRRLMRDLEEAAEAERAEKRTSYMREMASVMAQVNEARK